MSTFSAVLVIAAISTSGGLAGGVAAGIMIRRWILADDRAEKAGDLGE